MPKSKRNKQIELAKTKKRGLEWKKKLFEEIRKAVDSYSTLYVFTVNDMRNSKMKNVREQWKDSRFFIGKNKIMAMSLGRSAEEEYKPNLHKIGQRIKGQRALLFSNRSTDDVLRWFRSYSEGDFARSGNAATENVKLLEGPLPQFPHSLEPYLRQLGLPTTLVKGVIHLVKDHEVCKEGDILTPETAKILKLLGYEMAEFHITINCMWSQDGTFFKFTDDKASDMKENKKKRKSNSMVNAKTPSPIAIEEMEVEEDEISDSAEPPELLQEIECNTSKVMAVENNPEVSPTKAFNSTSTPSASTGTPSASTGTPSASTSTPSASTSTPSASTSTPSASTSTSSASTSTPSTSTPKENINNSVEIKQNGEECNKNLDECTILSVEKEIDVTQATPVNRKKKTAVKPSNGVDKEVSNVRPGRSRKRQVNSDAVLTKDSVFTTPDIANSSQDSPVFRELRNRSVKVIRKRNK